MIGIIAPSEDEIESILGIMKVERAEALLGDCRQCRRIGISPLNSSRQTRAPESSFDQVLDMRIRSAQSQSMAACPWRSPVTRGRSR